MTRGGWIPSVWAFVSLMKMTTKETIIAAAKRTFCANGFEAATIAEIARNAGLGHGTFYLYYKTKGAVIVDIAAREIAIIEARLRAVLNPRLSFGEQIKRLVRAHYAYVMENRDIYPIVTAGLMQDEALDVWGGLYDPVHRLYEEMLDDYRRRGKIRKNFDVKTTGRLIVGFVEFSAAQNHVYEDIPGEESRRHQRELAAFIEKGMA